MTGGRGLNTHLAILDEVATWRERIDTADSALLPARIEMGARVWAQLLWQSPPGDVERAHRPHLGGAIGHLASVPVDVKDVRHGDCCWRALNAAGDVIGDGCIDLDVAQLAAGVWCWRCWGCGWHGIGLSSRDAALREWARHDHTPYRGGAEATA